MLHERAGPNLCARKEQIARELAGRKRVRRSERTAVCFSASAAQDEVSAAASWA